MIKVQDLTKIYKSRDRENCVALDHISFTLPDAGMVFVLGKSGSGKSTLAHALAKQIDFFEMDVEESTEVEELMKTIQNKLL